MDLSHLSLKHVIVSNYKSLKRIDLDGLQRLALFMGRNNAGKSNILDSFKFLADAAVGFDQALRSRGGSLAEVAFRKAEDAKIEFAFDFVVSEEKRADLIQRLFAENQGTTPAQAIESKFLSLVTLKVSITRNQFSEELSVSNLRPESRPALVFSVKGSAQRVEAVCGCLETLCARCSGELPTESLTLEPRPESLAPYRLRLGRPESGEKYPISFEIAEMVYQQFVLLEWVDPLRRLPTSTPIRGELTVAPDASNLPDVLHWLYNNKPKQFRRIETEVAKLVPQLGRLYTPTVQNAATLGLIDSQDEDLVFSMDQMSFGTRSLIAIVAKVILAKPGSWVCVEEPETYLHPQAQIGLFHFLRDESTRKRIFVATHSTFIAASCPISSLFVVHRDDRGATAVAPVTSSGVVDVIEQLGVKPSFSFEADVIVFVEEADDIPLFKVWGKKFGFRINVQFIDVEAGETLHYYANARVALSRFVHTLVFAVYGNSERVEEQARQVQKRIVEHLELPSDQIGTLEVSEPEAYLFDAEAIRKAFPSYAGSDTEMTEKLVAVCDMPSPKAGLRELFAEFRLGEYNGVQGARIAEALTAIPPRIVEFFQRIDLASKPYLKI